MRDDAEAAEALDVLDDVARFPAKRIRRRGHVDRDVMAAARNDYWFVTNWQVEGACSEVADVLADPLAFPRWWLGVYLDVQELRPAGPTGPCGRGTRIGTRTSSGTAAAPCM